MSGFYANVGSSQPSNNAALHSTVKLYSTSSQREHFDKLADLYAIVRSIELLEKAYIKDSIRDKEYTPACQKLLAKYKTLIAQVDGQLPKRNGQPSVEAFMQEYRMGCSAAMLRINAGVPASMEHGSSTSSGEDGRQSAQYIAVAVQYFITLMDALKLNMVACDEIHPLLQDLLDSMNKVTTLGPDFEGKTRVKKWLQDFANMKASDELDEEQVRQLLFDLESSHSAFYKSLAPS